MADKIASGAWHERDPSSPTHEGATTPPRDPRLEARRARADRLRSRRDSARWSAVVGFALLFGASFSSAFLFGGVAMIVYGAAASVWWSTRLRKVEGDPWAYDPDLDGPQAPAWSREGKPPAKQDLPDPDDAEAKP